MVTPSDTVDAAACVNHEDVTRHVLRCRFCEQRVCPDCRELRALGGSGIQVTVCHACVASEDRTRKLKRAGLVVALLVLVVLAATYLEAPPIAFLPLLLPVAWLLLILRRYRGGVANRWDVFGLASIFSRFLR